MYDADVKFKMGFEYVYVCQYIDVHRKSTHMMLLIELWGNLGVLHRYRVTTNIYGSIRIIRVLEMDENPDNDRLLPEGGMSNNTTNISTRKHSDGETSNRNGSAYQGLSEEHIIEIEPNVSTYKYNFCFRKYVLKLRLKYIPYKPLMLHLTTH